MIGQYYGDSLNGEKPGRISKYDIMFSINEVP